MTLSARSAPPPRPQTNVPSLTEFASNFQPLPGQYQVMVLHPASGQPVTLAFSLPPSRDGYKTRITPRYLEFDSTDHTVGFRFARDGQVHVNQD